ncbi:hypothetical protein SUGI_0480080 [Cryptomeria japonica]|uniref:peroxidase 12 n=1 Tax=Cryptomeria japonica TaxID=3369 RepID=UPI0024089A49|nr:peroxidase 12 [Cryptomeria japonica]GLJ25101.1 hypothetical protein SUGI_0480080 [Cryptomeria japonica]
MSVPVPLAFSTSSPLLNTPTPLLQWAPKKLRVFFPMEKITLLSLFFLVSISFASARVENVLSLNADPPLANGLSWTFYKSTCPKLESIVKNRIKFYMNQDITQAAGLLRVHFHDCFVQGCDASVLLDGPSSEQKAPPNLTLRKKALEIINDIKKRVDEACGVVVSCADITTLATRDSVVEAGGPNYKVALGRRDSLTFASEEETNANLPGPSSKVSDLIQAFRRKSLDATDLVALSGAHTIGMGHCIMFTNRLYPKQDNTLDKSFAKMLYTTCPSTNSPNSTVLDIRTPNAFDNKYYVDLMNRQGLFTSDQDLFTNDRTKQDVIDFALNQTLFFKKFSSAMEKMGQLGVKTGSNGEIRRKCSSPNPTSSLATLVKNVIDSATFI